jgi:choline dehydrogenase
MPDTQTFDYIIAGAGSAGCVLANRLTANGKHRVLLLEAGGEDSSFWIHFPLGYGKHFSNPDVNWLYTAEPEPAIGNRRVPQPRGKVLGGSSSINGLVYIRGQREDYDTWRAQGNAGWGYEEVLPYFRKAEDQQHGENEYHGVGGPLKVSDHSEPHPLCDAFIDAAQACGYARNDDFNGATQEGFGYIQMTARNGWRSSAAKGYLHPVRKRSNLTVITHAHATRVLFEGTRATGIEYLQKGVKQTATAAREVIVSSGAFNSPQLLQLSGLGPAPLLQSLGIKVVADRPGVGANLQDHFNGRLVYECTEPITLNDIVHSKTKSVAAALRYVFLRKGLLNMAASYSAGFLRADPAAQSPDIQVGLGLFSFDKLSDGLHDFSGFYSAVRLLRPESRGTVMINNADPLLAPVIKPNYLSTEKDCSVLLAGLKASRQIMNAPAMRRYIVRERDPGDECVSDDALLDHIRMKGGISYHPVGTCRMGNDAAAVVDARLRVRGVQGLRVIDASIMPTLVSGNTNAAAIMIGEKGADMILEDADAR